MPGEGRKVWNFRGAEASREEKSGAHTEASLLGAKQGWKKRRGEAKTDGGDIGRKKVTTGFITEFLKESRNSSVCHLRVEAVDNGFRHDQGFFQSSPQTLLGAFPHPSSLRTPLFGQGTP